MVGRTSTDSPRSGRSGYYCIYVLVLPNKDGGHTPILNLKFFNLTVGKTSFKVETAPYSHHAPTQ